MVSAQNITVLTNDSVVNPMGDSFFRGLFGQRALYLWATYYINYFPQYYVTYRNHGRSGGTDLDFNTGQFPKYCLLEAGYTGGKTNYISWIHTSSNGGSNSNLVYTNIVFSLQFPTNSYDKNGNQTNDGVFPNAPNNYKFAIVGDLPSYSSGGNSTWLYSDAGKYAAISNGGWQFADAWHNLTNVTLNYNGGYPANSNLYFDNISGGVAHYDHPGNGLQWCWAVTTLTNFGADSNTWNALIDWNNLAVRQTNHCTVSSLSGNSAAITFTFRADRMGPGFWTPDGITTNDMSWGTNLMPSLMNAFNEQLRITNLPSGTFSVTIDSKYTALLSSSTLSSGYNYWMDFHNPWFDQTRTNMYLMCNYDDVTYTDACTQQPGGNKMNVNFESFANTVWPTNSLGVNGYLTNATMALQESIMYTNDLMIHTNAQQVAHTFSIQLMTYIPAPFR